MQYLHKVKLYKVKYECSRRLTVYRADSKIEQKGSEFTVTHDERLAIAWNYYENEMHRSVGKKYRLQRYKCDPFVPVIELENGLYCLPHYSPDRIATSNCYLVCGAERAMLIDTAYGIGDLKAMCGELTDLPVFVVNTHNHHDHTGGNTRFGACYMHQLDANKPQMLRRPQAVTMFEKNPDTFYTPDDIALPGTGRITPISNGHIFDLGGGYEIEVIHLAGHTAGSIALLDKKRGVLFTGDSIMGSPCSTLIVAFAGTANDKNATVEAFHENLISLAGRASGMRYLCPGHCAIQADPSLINDARECCRMILENPEAGGTSIFRPDARMRSCSGMSITYSPSHIYK